MSSSVATLQKKQAVSRINLNLSPAARADVDRLAVETHSSITELVRMALSLLRVVVDETSKGNKLIITTRDGTPQTQLVIPGL
jgi:hypothetical protein